ncbi:unnamed protein product [Didymodactylos carnosus]|uniref:Uncharacterized protein n=1 Tax=Didymodactylos carnosus TaxID=1234261 RepID=A0A813R1X6_9BILA|nr:unnamed protein product [Didymodactylos carnosus]CAF3557877.1 unnamed protein product [Didymodactylos carnosus]
MARRECNFVEFSDENDMKSFIKQNNVSIKQTETIALGKKVTYRCTQARKYPECNFQIRVIYYNDEKIAVSTSSERNHDNCASITRTPLPVTDIVKTSVAAGLTQSQTCRAVQNEYTSDVPSSKKKILIL